MPSTSFSSTIPSGKTLNVSVIHASSLSGVPTANLMGPPIPGFEVMPECPSFSFLLTHPSGQKVLFDLGIRSDYWNLASTIWAYLKERGYSINAERDVIDVLQEAGISGNEINAIIWRYDCLYASAQRFCR